VLLLNTDTQVAPDFLEPLLDVFNGDPRAAVSSAVMRLDSPEVLQQAWCDVHYGFGLARHVGVNALPGEGFDQPRRFGSSTFSALWALGWGSPPSAHRSGYRCWAVWHGRQSFGTGSCSRCILLPEEPEERRR
jgi:hypothetical protein